MSEDANKNFSGLLVECPNHPVTREDLVACRALTFTGPFAGKWESFSLESRDPLAGEEPRIVAPPYRYHLLIRRSGARLLLLGNHKDIAPHVLRLLQRVFRPRLRGVKIGVDQLVKGLTEKPTTYVLSFAHARVPAFGAILRSISFYGDDIGDASLFRQQMALMVFHTCGLRDARGGPEILRLGAEGIVSFFLSNPSKALEIEDVLRFLRNSGYLLTDIIGTSTSEER
jgi:hypothetical protein